MEGRSLTCVECGAVSSGTADSWRGYRVDLEEGDEPAVAFYCSHCAERERMQDLAYCCEVAGREG